MNKLHHLSVFLSQNNHICHFDQIKHEWHVNKLLWLKVNSLIFYINYRSFCQNTFYIILCSPYKFQFIWLYDYQTLSYNGEGICVSLTISDNALFWLSPETSFETKHLLDLAWVLLLSIKFPIYQAKHIVFIRPQPQSLRPIVFGCLSIRPSVIAFLYGLELLNGRS